MIFSSQNNRKRFFRTLFYSSLFSGVLFASSCTENNSKPTTPTNPGGGGNNGEDYVEGSGSTSEDGKLKLKVDNQNFDIIVTGENGNSLEDIVVRGDNFGRDIYGFSFEDPNHDYFSDVKYFDTNNLASIDGLDEHIDINESLNKIRGRKYEKKLHDKNEPYPYNLSQNRNLNFVETISIDDLHDFYVEHDAIFQNITTIEFMRDLTGSPELSFALEVAKFRQTFIENLNNYNDIVNSVASLFGGSFQKEAYYIDVYESKLLHVLTHQTTTKGNYITLKGTVYDNSNSDKLDGVFVNITGGPILKSAYSDDNGNYFLKSLTEGFYEIDATLPGFTKGGGGKRLSFFGYTQPRCEVYDCYLTQESSSRLDTLILQPGSEGIKDAFVHIITHPDGHTEGDNNNTGIGSNFSVSYSNDDAYTFYRARFFIKFNNIPYYSDVVYVGFGLYGSSADYGDYHDLATADIKKTVNSWDENSITWNNQPNFNQYSYDSKTPLTISGFNYWDITGLYQEWRNNPSSNYGVVFTIHSESYNQGYFGWTSENSNISRTPKMIIVREIEE